MSAKILYSFRVDPELRDAFNQAAKQNDRSSSQLLRDYMRKYVQDAKRKGRGKRDR